MLLDIHTHHQPSVPGESIYNIDADTFLPVAGCYYSVGIHPWRVTEDWEEGWERFCEVTCHPSVLAVGEAGLDKLCQVDISLQKVVFERQIAWSEEIGKPLVIHCVRAFNELVELKKKYRPSMPWVVHGFRNNQSIAWRLMQAGIHLSFGEKYQADALKLVPPGHLLTETDESILDIRTIVTRIAAERGVEAIRLFRQIDENARNIFFRH